MDAVEVNTTDPQQNDEGLDSAVEICRVCLLSNLVMQDLFLENEVESLSAKAMSFANVKMIPGDGLPHRVCCVCAAKLESAYQFKLQVEQADSVLRERCEPLNIKEELFFNEVEVHLEAERNEVIEEMHIEGSYESTDETLGQEHLVEKSTLLKDQLALLQVQQLAEQEQVLCKEQESSQEIQQATDIILAANSQQVLENTVEENVQNAVVNALQYEDPIKAETLHSNELDAISSTEHNYMIQQDSLNPNPEEHSSSFNDENISDDYSNNLARVKESDDQGQPNEQMEISTKSEIPLTTTTTTPTPMAMVIAAATTTTSPETPTEQTESSQNETRRSKRKAAIKKALNPNEDRDSDEENYFENLNLSSRLKKVQADNKSESEKVYFMCYLCDKQFISKGILKEHMHSHEEVRRTLSLKKSLDKDNKPQKSPTATPKTPGTVSPPTAAANAPTPTTSTPTQKMPPSGKKANKCPYCGKEYLYIISYNKHLKQHEKEKGELKEDPMPLEISFREDERSLDFDNCNNSQYSDLDCKKQTKEDQDVDPNDSELDDRIKESVVYSCNKCDEKFHTRKDLRKHLITHISLKCNVCEEEFNSLESLKNHRTKHVLEGVMTKEEFDTEGKEGTEENDDKRYDSSDHFNNDDDDDDDNNDEAWSEIKELKCPDCPMTYSHKNSLVRHMETHAGLKYTCKMCNQEFTRRDHLHRHMEQHSQKVKTYKCTKCDKSFGNELTLRNHCIATNHKTVMHGQEYDPNKRIKRVAAKAAQKIIDMIKTEDNMEYDDERDDEVCTTLEKRYSRNKREPGSKKTNTPSSKKELECATCNKKCTSKQSLTKHMEQHVKDETAVVKGEKSGDNNTKIKKEEIIDMDNEINDNSDFESGLDWPMDIHECATCKKRYSTKKSLLRHQLLHEEPNFECDICNVKFYRKDKLKAHYDKCSERNPDQVRKCNICGDSFENNAMLKVHRAKHVTEGILTEEDLRDIEPKPEERRLGEKITRKRRTDIVGLECTECNKQYTSRKGLLRHIQVHEGKKYLCDICPKKFYRREHLKIHVAKHNMIKPYKCNRCTKRFIKEEQLTNHLSKHDRTYKKNKETDSSKRFLCEICSKSFTQSTTLIAHLRAHNGIKPYVCEVCSRPFTTNAYLKMHMRTHTQERPYICQYCSRAFARADTLANHLTSHTGEAKYHCKYCPKNFRRLKSLKEHVFIHTGQRPYACPTCDRRFNNNGSRYAHSKRCKQNFLQNQNRNQGLTQVQVQHVQQQQQQQQPQQQQQQQTSQQQQRTHHHHHHQATTLTPAQVVKAQNIKTITIARPADAVTAQQVMQHQEILMPLILPLTVTLADVGEEVILPEGTKIFTTT